MIPTIEDIAKGLQDGSICYADAVAWLNQHAEFTDEKYQRYEMFKAVCLKLIRESSMTEWALNFNIAEAMTEAILTAAQEFSTKGKVGR